MLGQFLFITIGVAIFIIPIFYIRAKLHKYSDTPQDKLVFGPFTKGWIICWFITWAGFGIFYLIMLLLSYIGIDIREIITVAIILYAIAPISGNILQNYIDNKP